MDDHDTFQFSVEMSLRLEWMKNSSDPIERAQGAADVGAQGADGAAARWCLYDLLGDTTSLTLSYARIPTYSFDTTPGREAMKALLKIGEPAMDAIVRSAAHPEATARHTAIRQLSFCDEPVCYDPRLVDPLLEALGDAAPDLRLAATTWAGQYAAGDPEAGIPPGERRSEFVGPLLELLEKAPSRGTIEVLGILGPEASEAVPVLTGLLESEYEFIRAAAREALARIRGGP